VVWFGNTAPTPEDLKPYLEVRKLAVYHALQWLWRSNPLYHQISFNEDLIRSWPDTFIPAELQDSIVHAEDDRDEREGYAVDIATDEYENDLQGVIPNELDNPIGTGCVYSDVESARQHPTLQLISTIMTLERDRLEHEAAASATNPAPLHYVEDILVIRYMSNGRSVLMNDWQDAEYFTGAFPPLFPWGTGGHLSTPEKRGVPVSLKAWAKWALSHHSRR
jgi:hypothetical protein